MKMQQPKTLKDICRPYQKAWIKDMSRFKICNKARQIGFSFAEGFDAWNKALKGRHQIIVSSSWIQATYFMQDKIKPWADRFAKYYLDHTKHEYKFQRNGQTTLVLPNNAMIMVLPPNPTTIASFSGDVRLDEYARYTKSAEVYSAIKPSIDAGYNLSIFSSPYGNIGKFVEIWKDEKKYPQFSRHEINIYKAIEQGLRKKDGSDYDINELKLDSDFFGQEYECKFEASGISYYEDDLIMSCVYEPYKHDEFNDRLEPIVIKGRFYIGIDVGFSQDKTVIIVYCENEKDGILYEVDKRVLNIDVIDENGNSEYEINNQKKIILEYYGKYRPHKCRIDIGVGGKPLYDMLNKKIMIEGVNMKPIWKMEAGSNMKKLMATGKMKIKDDIEHIQNIQSCYVVGKEGSQTLDFKYTKAQPPLPGKFHGDICAADWLATYGFGIEKKKLFVR